MRPDHRGRCTPTGSYIRPRRSMARSLQTTPCQLEPTTTPPAPDLVAMDSYAPATSFYPCPLRASDIFKPQSTPPPTYYLKDHVRVEYNDSDWPTTLEGEEEASKEESMNSSNRVAAAGDARMVVRAQLPLGLLSVRMREYREKEKFGSNGSGNGDIFEGGAVRFSRYALCSISSNFTHPRSRAICAGCEGGYPARTTVRFEI
jgi:hypothetical protein